MSPIETAAVFDHHDPCMKAGIIQSSDWFQPAMTFVLIGNSGIKFDNMKRWKYEKGMKCFIHFQCS
jgi:hypothetical protein